MYTERNGFLARGDGLIQIPLRDVRLSIGFGERHYGSEKYETVEVAVLNKDDNYITRSVFKEFFGLTLNDDVAIVDKEELRMLIQYLSR